jgi:colicin import membrane protein
MKPAAAGEAPYRVPPEPSRWPAIALAAAVHAGLLLFLWIGINWQNTAPVAVEAEVWDMKTQAAAPPPPPPAPAEPVQAEERVPTPLPKVAEPPPPKEVEAPAAPKPPDIALERAKIKEKLKQEQQKLAEEQKLREERKANELAEKKAAEKLKAKELAEEKAKEKKAKQLADQKAKELADKKLTEKEAADKKLADKLAKSKQAAEEQKKLDKLRDAEMRRITGAAGTSGDAPKSTAPRTDSGYLASITSKIKSTTSYAGSTDLPGNPRAVFKIEELPTGEIISVKMIKSSGVPGFDDAVEKGIIKSSPLPKKKDGTVERTLEIAFSMKDLN